MKEGYGGTFLLMVLHVLASLYSYRSHTTYQVMVLHGEMNPHTSILLKQYPTDLTTGQSHGGILSIKILSSKICIGFSQADK